jgi:hypothetical protein
LVVIGAIESLEVTGGVNGGLLVVAVDGVVDGDDGCSGEVVGGGVTTAISGVGAVA